MDGPEDLFDREEEFRSIIHAALTGRMSLVLGVRRIGKTSLVPASTFRVAGIYVDMREFEWSPLVQGNLRRGLEGVGAKYEEAVLEEAVEGGGRDNRLAVLPRPRGREEGRPTARRWTRSWKGPPGPRGGVLQLR